ncbi:MAG: L,D-transpeptidase [Candidatus Dadabacteria bacterium]
MKNQIRIQALISFTLLLAISMLLPWQVTQANPNDTMINFTGLSLSKDKFNSTGNTIRITEKIKVDTIGQQTSIVNKNNKVRKTFLADKASATPSNCTKTVCSVYAEVDKSEQMMYVYIAGELQYSFPVSTGKAGHPTPDMDLRPAGPLYVKYTSTKYPEGDYQGLGNMPFVVFLKGGYAIHGTTPGSFRLLGRKASHGCIRLHPEDAQTFFELVKSAGLQNTWVTVHQ